jgi:hypothetical protein
MKHYDEAGREVVVGEAAIDWLTLTTYSSDLFDKLTDCLTTLYGKSEMKVKLQGYVGLQYDGNIKLLAGWQKKQPHYMLLVSAYHADQLFRFIRKQTNIPIEEMNCTRVDVQVTERPKRARQRLQKIGLEIEQEKYGQLKNRRAVNVRTISSNTGDTIYLGSPKSEKMVRIYDKHLVTEGGVNRKMERYEIQFKGATAQSVYAKMFGGGVAYLSLTLATIIKGDYELLPVEIQNKLALRKWKSSVVGTLITRAISTPQESNRLKWLRRMVKAIVAACNEPFPHGQIAMEFLLSVIIPILTGNPLENLEGWHLMDDSGNLYNVEHLDYNLLAGVSRNNSE